MSLSYSPSANHRLGSSSRQQVCCTTGNTFCSTGVERNPRRNRFANVSDGIFDAAIGLLSQPKPTLNPKAPTSSSSKGTLIGPRVAEQTWIVNLSEMDLQGFRLHLAAQWPRASSVRHRRVTARTIGMEASAWEDDTRLWVGSSHDSWMWHRPLLLLRDRVKCGEQFFTLRYATVVGETSKYKISNCFANLFVAYSVGTLRVYPLNQMETK